jgi:hypothetical protein
MSEVAKIPASILAMQAISALREQGRRSIRIVEIGCGPGERLRRLAGHARSLGFVAIEGRGVDADPAQIARARIAARAEADPAIALVHEEGDGATALREEAWFPADLLLLSDPREAGALLALASAAAREVIVTPAASAAGLEQAA